MTAPPPPMDASAPDSPGVGFKVGEYTITGHLGHGSMAEVYEAKDQTGHKVALKIFTEGPGFSQTMLERFRREAEATKQLRRHPNILTVYNTGHAGIYHFIAMERIPGGRTLEDLLRAHRLSRSDLVRLVRKVADALRYVHEHNIVHRDIKPANIMIDEFGEPLLADFGVAELVDWPSCTVSGALTGTPMYMAPEQARAERATASSDIYSLAVVLYEAITDKLPYNLPNGAGTAKVLEAVQQQRAIRARKRLRSIPRDLEYVLDKALAHNPRDRYNDMLQFGLDLECILLGKPVRAWLFMPVYRIRHLMREYRLILILLSFFLLVVSALLVRFWQELRKADYEQLIILARQRTWELPHRDQGLPSERWPEYLSAQRAMDSGEWFQARELFRAVAERAAGLEDPRTEAEANLGQARCEWMLRNDMRAAELYQHILDLMDANSSLRRIAACEATVLHRLAGRTDAANALYSEHYPEGDTPFEIFLSCLMGEYPQDELAKQIPGLPQRFRNEAQLIIGVRYHLQGHDAEAGDWLRACLRFSRPASEWPAPLAQDLIRRHSL